MGRVRYKQCGQQFALNVAYKVLYNAAYPTRVVQCPIWIVMVFGDSTQLSTSIWSPKLLLSTNTIF